MAQQDIDYGSYPDDASADAIRLAFQKTQENFDELYGNLSNITGAVTTVVAGNGITVSSATGDVTVNSTFNLLNVHSNTLTISGVGGTVTSGGTIGEDYTVNNASSTLVIEINSELDATFANLTVDGNLVINGNLISSVDADIEMTNGNITLINGSFTGDIVATSGSNTVQYANASNVITGDSNFTYNPTGSSLTLTNGNLYAAIITSEFLLNAVDVDISNSVTAANVVTGGTLTSEGNVNGVDGIFTGTITSPSIEIDSVQFTGLTEDPTESDGLMYYNSTTGKLRLYNGVDSIWQDLN